MDADARYLQERMRALRAFIALLEQVQKSFLGLGLDDQGRTLLAALDRKVSLGWQALSVAFGVMIFITLAFLARFAARSPLLLAGVIVAAALVGMLASAWLFWLARQRAVRDELRAAALELARLETLAEET